MPQNDAAGARCGICAIIERITAGTFADLIAELPRSWLILGDAQFYRGYCVLFAKRHVTEMHLMPRDERNLSARRQSHASHEIFRPGRRSTTRTKLQHLSFPGRGRVSIANAGEGFSHCSAPVRGVGSVAIVGD